MAMRKKKKNLQQRVKKELLSINVDSKGFEFTNSTKNRPVRNYVKSKVLILLNYGPIMY